MQAYRTQITRRCGTEVPCDGRPAEYRCGKKTALHYQQLQGRRIRSLAVMVTKRRIVKHICFNFSICRGLLLPGAKMTRSESSVIPFLVPRRRKVWLTPTAQVPCTCSNAANISERKTWTQSECCTDKIPLGSKSPRNIVPSPGDGQTSFKVWLTSVK